MTTIKSDMVRARVEPELKERAEAVLEKLGMSTADAIRIFLTQAAKTATEYAREQSDARIFDRIATIEASGTAILTLSDETRDAIRKAAGSVYESIRENIDPEIYDAYMEP